MKATFPEPILRLPEADLPFPGVKAYLSQSDDHQIIFMQFEQDLEVPEHAHAGQYAVVLAGRIDMVISGQAITFSKGDTYFIPAGTPHSALIHAGYADMTFFDEPGRYRLKGESHPR